jgi:hypothetical protein
MKSIIKVLFLIIPVVLLPACSSSKEGCEMNQQAKVGKNGELPTKRGKSSVVPKGMKKKMGIK